MPSIHLSTARRRELRALAHHLEPVVMVGGDGLTPAVMKECDAALASHGLIKVRVFSDDRAAREAALERLTDQLSAAAVQEILEGLVRGHIVSDRGGYGGRVTKYKQRFCNSEFGGLKLSAQELGIVCVLLLRGPQTPGELRAHTQRLCEFGDAQAVEAALESLMTRSDGPFVARLPRAPGARESRYAHLFSGHIESVEASASVASAPRGEGLAERIATVEETVRALREELDALKAGLGG